MGAVTIGAAAGTGGGGILGWTCADLLDCGINDKTGFMVVGGLGGNGMGSAFGVLADHLSRDLSDYKIANRSKDNSRRCMYSHVDKTTSGHSPSEFSGSAYVVWFIIP